MTRKKLLSLLLALVMVLSAFPISAFAAPASDIPDKMLDNPIVRALAYTGYNVQKQKDNGTIYQTGHYGGALKRNAPSILSDIHYSTSLTGKETVSDSSTVTGKAPNIARFEQYGLCCASFVTYYICNYLPNIEGVDTQFITDAINATGTNSQAVVTWQNARNQRTLCPDRKGRHESEQCGLFQAHSRRYHHLRQQLKQPCPCGYFCRRV